MIAFLLCLIGILALLIARLSFKIYGLSFKTQWCEDLHIAGMQATGKTFGRVGKDIEKIKESVGKDNWVKTPFGRHRVLPPSGMHKKIEDAENLIHLLAEALNYEYKPESKKNPVSHFAKRIGRPVKKKK